MSDDQHFAVLRKAKRIWAVASIHGEAEALRRLHKQIDRRFMQGDRLIYLGNYLGHGAEIRAALDELLQFRRAVIAQPMMFASDVVYLRGCQEEMWQKLLQLQFAPNPREVLDWMLSQGVGATMSAYGSNPDQAKAAARQGPIGITRWTQQLRAGVRGAAGHGELLTSVRRAAYTDTMATLFVSAGLDPSRPLTAQNDAFWWGGGGFGRIDSPYSEFRRIVRGFDPSRGGISEAEYTLCIDAGGGFGGPLVAACLSPEGEVLDVIAS